MLLSAAQPPGTPEAQWSTADRALWRRLVAESLGSALLAAVVIGSGIAAQRLSPSDVGLELFENAAVTAAGLFTIILMFGPISGGHFNPVVSFVDAAFGGLRWRHAVAYLPAQIAGCVGGAILANVMFSRATISISTKHRASGAHFVSEVVATLGLMLVIFALARTVAAGQPPLRWAPISAPPTSSPARPALPTRLSRSGECSPTALPASLPPRSRALSAAQVAGGVLAFAVIKALYPKLTATEAGHVVMPHGEGPLRVAIRGSVPPLESEELS